MPKTPNSGAGGGCFSKLLFLLLLAAAVGLGAAVYSAVQPQNLTDIGGYVPPAKPIPERDLKLVLQNAIDRGYAVTLSETEINQWLGRTLATKQGGILAESITLDRVWIRLEENRAEVIMVRNFQGKPFTVSMYLQVEQVEDLQGPLLQITPSGGPYLKDYPYPPKGGRFGKLVVPMGFLHLVMPAYQKLPDLFAAEIELAFTKMSRIRIEKGQLVLDPREPLGQQGMPDTF